MEPDEFKKCQDDPLYWYNTYYKNPNDPVLTQDQLDQRRIKEIEIRNKACADDKAFLKQPMRISESFKTKK